jgi:hypothetical protein
MTLNKVPNTDDLKRYTIAQTYDWTFTTDSSGTTDHGVSTGESANGTVSSDKKRTALSHDGTSDEYAACGWAPAPTNPGSGSIMVYHFGWSTSGIAPNFSNPLLIGLAQNPANDPVDSNRQIAIRADDDEFTVVDGAGNKSSESLTISDYMNGATNSIETAIVIDQKNDVCECYLTDMPLIGTPDASISGVPTDPFEQPQFINYGGPDTGALYAYRGGFRLLY